MTPLLCACAKVVRNALVRIDDELIIAFILLRSYLQVIHRVIIRPCNNQLLTFKSKSTSNFCDIKSIIVKMVLTNYRFYLILIKILIPSHSSPPRYQVFTSKNKSFSLIF